MIATKENFKVLNERRRALGMSYSDVAKRSGVSVATVTQVLSDDDCAASFSTVQAIADALGVDVNFTPTSDPEEFRLQQARQKAQRLVSMVQGNSALEGQAVDLASLTRMLNQTIHKLLAGSGRLLWGD